MDARIHARRMTAPLLVMQDHLDETVPFSHGADIARMWPGATLIGTSGLGHSDLLEHPQVIAKVLDFVSTGSKGGVYASNTVVENQMGRWDAGRLAG